MARKFDSEIIRRLDEAEEVRIETRGRDETHRTIIWIVVDADQVFVRSVRGPRGRWFRELVQAGEGAIVVGRRRIPVRATLASDPNSIERCSRALREKYRRQRGSLASMLQPHTLETTALLEPAEDSG